MHDQVANILQICHPVAEASTVGLYGKLPFYLS